MSKLVCGKPMSHWENEADELVIYQMLRAMSKHIGNNVSVINKLAYVKWQAILDQQDQKLVERVKKSIHDTQRGMQYIMQDLAGE